MRKSSFVSVLGLFFLVIFSSGAAHHCFAATDILSTFSKKEKGSSKKDEEARVALRKMIVEKKGELNGSSWTVKIDSQSKRGDLLGDDTLVFQNDKFRSEKSGKLGYNSTNYTLTVQEEVPTIWETMQTSQDGEVCFWRGEWKDNVMTGIISRQLEKGSEEYYFSSSERKEIPKNGEEKEETTINPLQEAAKPVETEVLGGATAAPSKTTAAKPKKKGWF